MIVLNPLKKPFDVGLEDDDSRSQRHDWKKSGDHDKFSALMKQVRLVDLRMVDKADFIIAKIDMDVPMCGTLEEIFWANRMKRPVLVWCPQGKLAVPDWLWGTLPHEMFFDSLADVLTYLDEVNTSTGPDPHRRWLFANTEDLYTPEILAMLAE